MLVRLRYLRSRGSVSIYFHTKSMASQSTISQSQVPYPDPERTTELSESLDEICQRVRNASNSRKVPIPDRPHSPVLIAVSKLKPASDILACYEHGQRDFGENYVQELIDKAQQLPNDIRWHFIGTLQSNKAKLLASIPNLYAIQTLGSMKGADALNRALPSERESAPLNILLQVNTSGEESKSGLPPLVIDSEEAKFDQDLEMENRKSELFDLAVHVLNNCPRLHFLGLMTIGSITESKDAGDANSDFERLRNTRDKLEQLLSTRTLGKYAELKPDSQEVDRRDTWGRSGRLLLSMGMSSDFEAALRAGSDFVRVGTSIFGERRKKAEN